MPRIIKNNLGKFLIVFALVLVLSATFFFLKNFSAKAQEQIKIVPESFSGDWQNAQASFSHDLDETALFEEFNITNSAYPLESSEQVLPAYIEQPVEQTTTTEEITISEQTSTTTEEISTTTEEIATTTEEIIIPEETSTTTEEITTTTEEVVVPEEQATTTEEIATTTEEIIIPEEATSTSATTTLKINSSSFFATLWTKIKRLFNNEAKAESLSCKHGVNRPCGTQTGVCQIGVQVCQQGIWSNCFGGVEPSEEVCDQVDNDCDGEVDEGLICTIERKIETCQPGSNRPCGTEIGACQVGVQICEKGIWGECIGGISPSKEDCDSIDNDCDGQVDEGEVCKQKIKKEKLPEIETPREGKILVFSGFGIAPPKDEIIKSAQLRLSLAGKGELGDELFIDYFYDNAWRNLAIFDLQEKISNNLNEGFFLYGLPIFEDWEDLNKLKVRLTYVTNNPDKEPEVFVDAIWIEIDTEAKPAEKPVSIGGRYSLKTAKKEWKRGEQPEFEIEEMPQGFLSKLVSMFSKDKKSIVLIDPVGNEITEGITIDGNNIKVEKHGSKKFRAGLYKIRIEIKEAGEVFIWEQDFLWGVLAINPDKAIYKAGETSLLSIGILNDKGQIICNADVDLTIRDPIGNISERSTMNGDIIVSDNCMLKDVFIEPDYFTEYVTELPGTYTLTLTATHENGTRTVVDTFEAEESPTFILKRTGPTRVFPVKYQPMDLEITAYEDFNGEIIERLPKDFLADPGQNGKLRYTQDQLEIIWNKSIKAGEILSLSYSFKAVEESPSFYLAGPASIGDWQETRQWQFAIDPTYMYLFWDSTASPDFATGWSVYSTDDTRFPIGTSTSVAFGTDGGAATHNAVLSGSVSQADTTPDEIGPGGGTAAAGYPHTHSSLAVTPVASNNLPAYRDLVIVKSDAEASAVTQIPIGFIAVFDDDPGMPGSGWTQVHTDGRMLRANSAVATGGSDGHQHTLQWSADVAPEESAKGSTVARAADDAHTHSFADTQTAVVAGNSLPPYIEVVLADPDATTTVPVGMIAMFDGDPGASFTIRSDSGGPFENQFIRGAAAYNGTSQGALTHSHAQESSAETGVTRTNKGTDPGTGCAGANHTHTLTASFVANETHMPLFFTVVYAEKTSTANSPPTIAWLTGFHDDEDITIPEWSSDGAQGTYVVTTTFRVTDTNAWTDISTTTLFVYRSGQTGNCSTTADASPTKCYPATTTASNWTIWQGSYPNYDTADSICNIFATGTNTADFWCTTTMYYCATATDATALDFSSQWWEAYVSTSDKSGAQGVAARGNIVDVNTNKALAIDVSTINYSSLQTLTPGTDTGYNWATSVVTTTGNVSIDVHFDGGALWDPGLINPHIPAENQRFTTTSGSAYTDSWTIALATSYDVTGQAGNHVGSTHDLYMRAPTTTSPGPLTADEVYWGIKIPAIQAADTYSSSTNLTATTTIKSDD